MDAYVQYPTEMSTPYVNTWKTDATPQFILVNSQVSH